MQQATENLAALLGQQLREYRMARHDRQKDMAIRIGVSEQTYARMEKGDARVALEYWLRIFILAGWSGRIASLMQPEPDLFAEVERIEQAKRLANHPRRIRKHG